MLPTLSLVRVAKRGPRFFSAFTHPFCIFSFEGFDFAGVFLTFFGVEVALAAFDPARDREGFLTEMVRLARRLEFLWRTLLVVARRSLRDVRSLASTDAPLGPLWPRSEPKET